MGVPPPPCVRTRAHCRWYRLGRPWRRYARGGFLYNGGCRVGDAVPGGSGGQLRVGSLGLGYRSFRICPDLSLRSVIDGGSPRACRAWPLAWPSPSGPLGRQRLRGQRRAVGTSRVAGCEAPLRLEGPTRTMRGVPARCRTFRPATGAPSALRPAWPARGAHGPRRVTAGCVLRPVRGIGAAGSGPRRCAAALEAAGQAAPPPAARVPITPGRYGAALSRSFTLSVLGSRILRESRPGPVGLARRRCALEAV